MLSLVTKGREILWNLKKPHRRYFEVEDVGQIEWQSDYEAKVDPVAAKLRNYQRKERHAGHHRPPKGKKGFFI